MDGDVEDNGEVENSTAPGFEATPAPLPEAADSPLREVIVTGKRPAKDETGDSVAVSGDRTRNIARASTFEALSRESADVYVSGRGAGIHGVASGASGSVHIRGLGDSPNSQVLIVEDGVPDYQGIFGHPIPDAYAVAQLMDLPAGFLAGLSLVSGWPGIILMIVVVPPLVLAAKKKYGLVERTRDS